MARFRRFSAVLWLAVFLVCASPSPNIASVLMQTQCSIADIIDYPVDTSAFQLSQDYGTASPRHQGRFHTGEDWFLPSGAALGQPVRAAAAGRVTYSAPTGWGRDGGVIIIEHTFPDGSTAYSQYGHIAQSDTVTFPPRFSCVQAGDIIAVIGDARPSPHLHFEIRASQPDIPGPGYSREAPVDAGWLRPAQFVTNRRAWLNAAHAWHYVGSAFGPAVPPLMLNDHSMLVVDGSLLRFVTWDGRVLWRIGLERAAVSVTGFQANPYLIYTDGGITRIDFDGSAVERWTLNFTPDGPPFRMGESLVFHTSDDALVALAPNLRDILWRLDGVPAFSRAHVSADLIGLVTVDSRLLLVSHDGILIGEAELSDGASMATAPDGTLAVYTRGGVWWVNSSGVWSPALEGTPPGGGSAAMTIAPDGRIFLLSDSILYAYTVEGALAWQASLPQSVSGMAEMNYYDGGLLVTSSHGSILVARSSGGICGFTRIYGDDRARVWHHLGGDNTLRVAVGDQIIGLDWVRFAGSCIGSG